jgi:photosystem II stability/assembly factor-like uncharacterized protein
MQEMCRYLLFLLFFIQSLNLYSSDWKFIKQLNTGNYVSINCNDSKTCFALTQQTGVIELNKSSDKGKTWSMNYQSDPMDTEPKYLLNAQQGANPHPDYYYVIFYEGCYVTKSIDGGKTFKKIKIADSTRPYEIVMKDKDNGLIITVKSLNTYVYVTNDGCETFRKLDTVFHNDVSSPIFSDDNNIFLIIMGKNSEYYMNYDFLTNFCYNIP